MLKKLNQKIFFYTTSSECNSLGAEGAWFQDLIVNLAEGFNSIGVQHYSNSNYWRLTPEDDKYLLQNEPNVTHKDCDIVILERQYFEENGVLPDGLFESSRKYITVYLDCADGIRTVSWLPEFRQFDFIFKTHYIKDFKYPSNMHPWAFGLSSRVLNELCEYKAFGLRERKLLLNFEYRTFDKFSHSLRKLVAKSFIPSIEDLMLIDTAREDVSIPPNDPYHYLRWLQTGRRHIPNYYRRLKNSQACAAFGGNFLAPRFTDFNPKTSYYSSRIIDKIGIKTKRIAQWDSWRLWESLASGCVTFHVDFQKYGFVLPVSPVNWKHYIGIDLDNIHSSVHRIREQPELLEKISAQGRAWAIQNYSPEAMARHFLKIVLT